MQYGSFGNERGGKTMMEACELAVYFPMAQVNVDVLRTELTSNPLIMRDPLDEAKPTPGLEYYLLFGDDDERNYVLQKLERNPHDKLWSTLTFVFNHADPAKHCMIMVNYELCGGKAGHAFGQLLIPLLAKYPGHIVEDTRTGLDITEVYRGTWERLFPAAQ